MIFENVIDSLLQDPSKRFNWAETVYFSMWWNAANESRQNDLRQLVQRGQWEFVGGGWVQNDEAVAHYAAVIDQMTLGHLFLLSTVGVVPRVGWQIDPFGASSITPLTADGST